jgi:hypothetical protein
MYDAALLDRTQPFVSVAFLERLNRWHARRLLSASPVTYGQPMAKPTIALHCDCLRHSVSLHHTEDPPHTPHSQAHFSNSVNHFRESGSFLLGPLQFSSLEYERRAAGRVLLWAHGRRASSVSTDLHAAPVRLLFTSVFPLRIRM